jgi:hypothetical protein
MMLGAIRHWVAKMFAGIVALVTVAVGAVALGVSATPAAAATAIPQDVQAYFREKMPAEVKTDLKVTDPNITAIQKTYVVAENTVGKAVIQPSGDWTGAVYDTVKPVGTATVMREKDGTLSGGSSNDASLARYLVTVKESGGDLVEVSELENAIFIRKEGIFTPLNSAALNVISAETSEKKVLAEVQKKFDEQKSTGGGSTVEEPPTWAWLWIVGVLALAILMSSGIYMATSGRKKSHNR